MILCDFKDKLRQLNDKLYIIDATAVENYGKELISGIWLRNGRSRGGLSNMDLHYVDNAMARRVIQDGNAGLMDTFICGCNIGETPEYDRFDLDARRMIHMGWRTIVLTLVKRNICTLDRARKVFNCSSLGESDYDKLDFFAKQDFVEKMGITYEPIKRSFRI